MRWVAVEVKAEDSSKGCRKSGGGGGELGGGRGNGLGGLDGGL
jgi:hypothetical protein